MRCLQPVWINCKWNNLVPVITDLAKRNRWKSPGFVPTLLLTPRLCRPSWPFFCTFLLPCIKAKFNLTMVPTCKVSPHSVSFLSTCFPIIGTPPHLFVCSSFWHEALNISSALLDFPFAHPALFMKPLYCLLKATGTFKAYLYKELMWSTMCRHTEERLSVCTFNTQSYLVVLKSFSVTW